MTKLAAAPLGAAGMSREVIIESVQIGNSVRITAVDAATGTEVMFQAPARTSQSEIQKLAVQKLKYVMNKQKS